MTTAASSPRLPLARLAKTALGSSVYAGSAFLGAGQFDWMRGWLYAVLFVAVSVAGAMIVHAVNPGLMDARARGFRQDTKPFDRLFYLLFLPLALSYPALAGLDAVRLSFAPLPDWTIYPGVLLFMIGASITTWTMVVNAHAESTVRIQTDRHHAVVTAGPYAIVRHPMYFGMIVGLPAAALILGSGASMLWVLPIFGLFVWRTAREDQVLRDELPGYADYAAITRYRLLPGVW